MNDNDYYKSKYFPNYLFNSIENHKKSSQGQINHLLEEIEELKKENKKMNSSITSKNKEIEDLKNKYENEFFYNKYLELSNENQTLKSDKRNLEKEKENLKSNEKKIEKIEEQNRKLNSELISKKKDIKNLIDENENLKRNIKSKENSIENLQKEKQTLNSDLSSKNNKIIELENQLNELKNTENGKMLYKYLEEKTNKEKLVNELYKIKKENEIYRTQTNNNLKKLNYELNEELMKERDITLGLKNELEKLKRKKFEQFESYKKNDYNEEYIGKELENFYDIIINIKSIRALSNKDEGWQIKWNKNRNIIKNILNLKEKLLKVGILGNGNMGKSFLLSRIFDEKIPSGYSVITEGLSIKINQNNCYALLDSAGLQTPLLKSNEMVNQNIDNEGDLKEYENLYKDKTQTENFIQNLILYLSDMLFIVVGKITFNEQRLINKIKNELNNFNSQNQKTKKNMLFIIHNLSNFQTISQVKEHIDNTLLKSASFKLKETFDIEKSKGEKEGKRIYYIEENTDMLIYHLIMAREETEAGDYYNNYTYQFLKERFNDFPHRSPLSILDEIKNKFAEWSNDLLEEKIDKDKIILVKDGDVEKQIIYDNTPKDGQANNNENYKEIVPKACISDELGLSIYRSSGYEPSYVCYLEDKKKLVVKMELAGNISIEDSYADLYSNQIIIKGNKYDNFENNNKNGNNKDETEKIKILKNTRKYGKFNLIIPFGNEIKLADEEPINEEENKNEIKKEDGIKTIKFKLARRRENKK